MSRNNIYDDYDDSNYYGAARLRDNDVNPCNYRYAGDGYYENKGICSDIFFDADGNMHRTM